jgi:hypothetical protein
VKFCVFRYIFWFSSQKNFWGHISTFCKVWSRTRKKRPKKSKHVLVNVS